MGNYLIWSNRLSQAALARNLQRVMLLQQLERADGGRLSPVPEPERHINKHSEKDFDNYWQRRDEGRYQWSALGYPTKPLRQGMPNFSYGSGHGKVGH